jgi:hypothetical protein
MTGKRFVSFLFPLAALGCFLLDGLPDQNFIDTAVVFSSYRSVNFSGIRDNSTHNEKQQPSF